MSYGNTSIGFIIKVRPEGFMPVGYIPDGYIGTALPSGFLWCDGSHLVIDDYPDLFRVIGHSYSKKTIEIAQKPNFIQRIFGLKTNIKRTPNPEYKEGTFGLPDPRSGFLKQRELSEI